MVCAARAPVVSGVVELEVLVLLVAAMEVEPVVSGLVVVEELLGVDVLAVEESGVVAGGVDELLACVEPVPGAVDDVGPVVSGDVLVEAVVPLKVVLLVLGAPGSDWVGYWVEVVLEVESGVEVGVVLLELSEPAALEEYVEFVSGDVVGVVLEVVLP